MRLNELKDKKGARKSRMRVGRGIGSGKGKTSGRGAKGQKSRSGVAIKGFEGGQMPIHMRLPKRGFKVPFPKQLNEVNLGRLQAALMAKKLDKDKLVNAKSLKQAGVIRHIKDGIKILGKGELTTKIDLEAEKISKSAKDKLEALGGKIILLESKKRTLTESQMKKQALRQEKQSQEKAKKLEKIEKAVSKKKATSQQKTTSQKEVAPQKETTPQQKTLSKKEDASQQKAISKKEATSQQKAISKKEDATPQQKTLSKKAASLARKTHSSTRHCYPSEKETVSKKTQTPQKEQKESVPQQGGCT